MEDFEDKLRELINCYSLENNSNTPDFILAKYMKTCLDAFHEGVKQRESWYGRVGDNDKIQRIRSTV